MKVVSLLIIFLLIILIGIFIYRKNSHKGLKILLTKLFILGIVTSILFIIFYKIIPIYFGIDGLDALGFFIYRVIIFVFKQPLLSLIAVLPVILVGSYIYRKDKNREPKLLLLEFFLLGLISSFLLILLYKILPIKIIAEELNPLELFIYVFIFVALLEELFKWIPLYFLGYNNKEFDELYDIIVYSVFTALGFAVVENMIYIIYEGQITTGIYRGILAIPGHTCFAIFMGYYLSVAKHYNKKKQYKLESINKVKSIIVPIILHGVYDYCCMLESYVFVIIFFVFTINLFIFSYKKLKYTLDNNEI